jgi:hypothetical protein
LRQNIVESFWGCDVPKEWAPSKFHHRWYIKWNTAKLYEKKAPKKGPLWVAYYGMGPLDLEMRGATTFRKVGDGSTKGLFRWLLVYWTIINSHY